MRANIVAESRREEVSGMRLPYGPLEYDEAVKTLARELVNIVIKANMSYKKSMEALECAQCLIESETKPVIS